MNHRRVVLALVLAAAAAVLLLPSVAAAMTYDQAVDQLYAKGYPQNVETYLNSLGTSPLGFRLGGTVADDTAARYLERKLRAAGYDNVKLEAVPVDEWAVRGASVTVDDRSFVCSQFAGVPGTGEDGITAEVVYVGTGLAADYEGVDVTGKIVVVDSSMDNVWFNFQGAEATKHGALAAILTSNFSDGTDMDYPSYPWYVIQPDALGANDGEYDMSFVPLIYMSQQDGDWLKAEIAGGFTEATFVSKVDITLADDGGTGYNVVATLPGTQKNGQMVIWNAHHDAHFRAGLDDTGAVVATLAAAKAMKMSGYTPKRASSSSSSTPPRSSATPTAGTTGASAPGTSSRSAIRTGWARSPPCAASSSWRPKAPPSTSTRRPSSCRWLDAVCADRRSLIPNGYADRDAAEHVAERLELQASGVPSFEVSAGGPGYDLLYHSTYENQDMVDWD